VQVACGDVCVRNLTVEHSGEEHAGLYLGSDALNSVTNCTVAGCIFFGNRDGIMIVGRSRPLHHVVADCVAYDNTGVGAYIGFCSHVTVVTSSFLSNEVTGIDVKGASTVSLRHTRACGNGFGCCPGAGLSCSSSSGCTVRACCFAGNREHEMVFRHSDGVLVYENAIAHYADNVLLDGVDGTTASFTHAGRGNFWSGFKMTDANGDGIADQTYPVAEDVADEAPLSAYPADAPYGVQQGEAPAVTCTADLGPGIAPGTPVTFTARVTYAGDILAHRWDLGDGNEAFGARVNHSFEHPGTYTIRLKVLDDAWETSTCSLIVRVLEPGDQKTPAPAGGLVIFAMLAAFILGRRVRNGSPPIT
jgi:parallel beta-helix repeat protein